MDETDTERFASVPSELDVLLEASRALLWINNAADARSIAAHVVTAFGGVIVPARDAGSDALPVDVSFGDGEPVVPSAPAASVARTVLERHLPSFVADARRAVELGVQAERLAEDAAIDTLTRLPNRRMLGRALGRARAGDVVVLLDLDHFKQINDTLGHDAGDQVLQALGRILRATVRGDDVVGRFGGEEFVIVLRQTSDPEPFLRRLRNAWEHGRPHPISFSAGIARVSGAPAAALTAADRAMYRAKAAGRNQWAWSTDERALGEEAHPDRLSVVPLHHVFVAFSELEVPAEGEEALETAFRERLGAVDAWPGFSSLQVWADLGDPRAYAMVTWWESADAFGAYMRSEDHRRSHERIPAGEHRPRARRFRRFRVVAR